MPRRPVAATPPAASLLLFCRCVVPLDRGRHRHLALATALPYANAAACHLLPAVVEELASACVSMPILCAPDVQGVSPVPPTGLQPGNPVSASSSGE